MKLANNNLEKCFTAAIKNNCNYVGVLVWMYGFETPEVIINETSNFKKKLSYYKHAYNENLTLRSAPDKIKIIGFAYGNSFEEIKEGLLRR